MQFLFETLGACSFYYCYLVCPFGLVPQAGLAPANLLAIRYPTNYFTLKLLWQVLRDGRCCPLLLIIT